MSEANPIPPACSALTEGECDRLSAYFSEKATVEIKDCYWIDGDDVGDEYCRECAEKELVRRVALFRRKSKHEKKKHDRPSLGGGFAIEHDGLPYCEKCGVSLDGCLTAYGCEEEIRNFLANGFDIDSEYTPHSCYAMERVVSSMGWHCHEYEHEREWERSQKRERYADLHKLGRVILDALNVKLSGENL